MVSEKLITKDEALLRIDPKILDTLLHPTLDPKATKNVIAKGFQHHQVLQLEKLLLMQMMLSK